MDDEESPETGLGPDIPDSTPDIPDSTLDLPDSTPELPDPSNAPPELQQAFTTLVAVFNVALLATSVGLMLVGFLGEWQRGGALTAFGLAAFAYGYWKYRNRPRFD